MISIHSRNSLRTSTLRFATMLGLAFSAQAHAEQDQRAPTEETTPVIVAPQAGQTAEAGAGQVGRRQTRAAAAETIGVVPMARIDNRIQNRVQSRIRNRIDQNYDPRANATSPFSVAGERIRAATGSRRR